MAAPPPAWSFAPRLAGRHAVLEPLSSAHADALHQVVVEGGLHRLWYTSVPAPGRLGIGYTWYSPRAQRTGGNSECKLMLLRHAFEALGCASVFFETSRSNQRSRQAIARLGAKQDGILRNCKRHADGSLRDTVVFSIIDTEWPAARSHRQFRLGAHP